MGTPFDPTNDPHRRYNPLLGEWVLVSPHRAKRPWQGASEEPNNEQKPSYDSTCYLCPTNTRVNGEVNPDYKGTFVFREARIFRHRLGRAEWEQKDGWHTNSFSS